MINRGRFRESTVKVISDIISKSNDVVCIFGESDSSDKELSLDGRRVLKDIVKATGRSDYSIVTAKNQNIGMNALLFGDMELQSSSWRCINRNNLKFPQSISERYMHHRMYMRIKLKKSMQEYLGVKYLSVFAQHQSAFIRPLTRFRQARDMLRMAKNRDKKDVLTIIGRDQNTFLPGEERIYWKGC
jgi:hypothetical protein